MDKYTHSITYKDDDCGLVSGLFDIAWLDRRSVAIARDRGITVVPIKNIVECIADDGEEVGL